MLPAGELAPVNAMAGSMPLAGQFHAKFRTPALKTDFRRPKMAYTPSDDGSPPVRAVIHVRFIAMCAPIFQQTPSLISQNLVDEWNASHTAEWKYSLSRLGGGSGKVDQFFINQ